MYSRKRAGSRMVPKRTPALTGHSCKDFPSRTTVCHLQGGPQKCLYFSLAITFTKIRNLQDFF